MSVFRFDDRTIGFEPGQTVAAALMAADKRSWRSTRVEGRPRGLFCGIGICFDCLVIVDGKPNQRACLELAGDGMQVRTQEGTGHGELAV